MMPKKLDQIFDTTIEKCQNKLLEAYPAINEIFESNTPLILHPAGRIAERAAKWLSEKGLQVRGFSDSDPGKQGKMLLGLPIFNPTDASAYKDCCILIASSVFDSEICDRLRMLGHNNLLPYPLLAHFFPEAFVVREYRDLITTTLEADTPNETSRLYDVLADEESRSVLLNKLQFSLTRENELLDAIYSSRPMYFDENLVPARESDVIADCGAYVGDTLKDFLAGREIPYEHYHAFEPGDTSFEQLRLAARDNEKAVSCVKCGVHERTGQLHLLLTQAGIDCEILEKATKNTIPVDVVSLDDYFHDKQPPTIIKMDIEGCERQALAGARRLIDRHSPCLAISVYHHPHDLWQIPLLMHDMLPTARIYLRHYTREIVDTVCYAVTS